MVLPDIIKSDNTACFKAMSGSTFIREGDPLSHNMSSRPFVAKFGINGNFQSVILCQFPLNLIKNKM